MKDRHTETKKQTLTLKKNMQKIKRLGMRGEARTGKKERQTDRHEETDTEREKKRRREIERNANPEKDEWIKKERDGTEEAKGIGK